jgi:hypothetical protein
MSFGSDVYMYDRLVTGRMATGVTLLAQAVYRRLTTPRGTLDDGDEGVVYGLDLSEYIGRQATPDAIANIGPALEAEILKDDRVASATATASAETGADGLTLTTVSIDVIPYDETAAAPFAMTLAVSDVTVSLLGVSPL